MKIAIFHNFMDNIGGAEMVGLTLARALDADIFTTNIDWGKIRQMGFSDVRLHSIGRVPVNPPFRQQLAWFLFRSLNLRKQFDFYIIDGDWAMSGTVHNKPNLWYVHSPIREIWDLYEYTKRHTVRKSLWTIYDCWVHFNRYFNRRDVRHVTHIACNSKNTQARVFKFLNRSAQVIHPPVETGQFYHGRQDYWLSVNRLISHKRIEMQIEAFRKLAQEQLIIVGSYERSKHFVEYARHIQTICPPNVRIKSWVERKDLIDLYAHCKGFITTSQDEDFGMNVVEAMAAGKPVIAPNEGGYRETIIHNQTGYLIDNIHAEKIIDAIQKVEAELALHPTKFVQPCQAKAQQFDTSVFVERIKNLIGYSR